MAVLTGFSIGIVVLPVAALAVVQLVLTLRSRTGRSLAGVLLGLTVLALAGGGTPLNDAYHRTLLLALLATLLLQLTTGRRRETSSIVAR